jgi:hypothetical protein
MKDRAFVGMVGGSDVTNIQEWADGAFLRTRDSYYEF